MDNILTTAKSLCYAAWTPFKYGKTAANYLAAICRIRRNGEPPKVPGSWFFLDGNGRAFNDHAVNFLQSSSQKYGPIFNIRLLDQWITIVMDPQCYDTFGREENFDFNAIQEQVNWNVFSYVLKDANMMIRNTAISARKSSLDLLMKSFHQKLEKAYAAVTPSSPSDVQLGRLRNFCSLTLFDAVFNSIFGDSQGHVFNSQNTFHNFEVFHRYFNYFWLGLPKCWFREAQKVLVDMMKQPTADEFLAREDLSEYMRNAITSLVKNGQTHSDIMGHNLVYLHVNYNTVRLAFWVLYFLLQDPEAMKAVKTEIQEEVDRCTDSATNTAALSWKAVDNLPVLAGVMKETFRVASGVFMIRKVLKDTSYKLSDGSSHMVRGGDRVAIYPPAIHWDSEIFEDPMTFKYDRFLKGDKFYKNGKEITNPIRGYGIRCPGIRCAEGQAKWFIATLLTKFDLSLKEGQQAELDTSCYGHEILPPKKDVDILYTLKINAPKFEMVTED